MLRSFLAVIGSLSFNYSYKFQPKEFTGKLHHISRPSEGIGAYSIHVELPDGAYKTITLPLVICSYPWPIHERDHINKTFELARNKPTRVEVMEWKARDRGMGFVYVNDEDIALLLLREGYLKVYPSDWEIDGKKMRDKLQTYQRAEELAMEEDKGIWGKFD